MTNEHLLPRPSDTLGWFPRLGQSDVGENSANQMPGGNGET